MKGSQNVSLSTLMTLIDGIPDGKYNAVLDCNAYTIINENERRRKKRALVLLPLQFHTFFTLDRESLVA